MLFCPTCGTEIPSDKKFCGHCGADLKYAQIPPAPVQETPAPPPPMPPAIPPRPITTGPISTQSTEIPIPLTDLPTILLPPPTKSPNRSLLVIILVIVGVLVIIAAFVFFNPQFLQNGDWKYAGPVNSALVSAIVITPVPTQAAVVLTPASGPTQNTVYLSGEAYTPVYSVDQPFKTGQSEVFSYNLEQLPMVIQLEFIPKMSSRKKLVDIGTANERYITAEYPSPYSWFEIKVINVNTGGVLTSLGFGKNYNVVTKQEYTIRTNGKYRFEMQGNEISANVKLLIKS